MIQYDEKSIYIIGGVQNHLRTTKTWIVTNRFQKIKEGPSLNKARSNHGCAKMTFNGRTILVVAGGCGAWDSVDILDPIRNVWTSGWYLKFIIKLLKRELLLPLRSFLASFPLLRSVGGNEVRKLHRSCKTSRVLFFSQLFMRILRIYAE